MPDVNNLDRGRGHQYSAENSTPHTTVLTVGTCGPTTVSQRMSRNRTGGEKMTQRKQWTVNKTRSGLYRIARLLGDFQAIRKGRVGRRVGRRVAGKFTGRGLGKIFR